MKVRILLGALVVLVAALSLGAGCGQGSSGQSQELEQQQQENEELRKEIEAQKEAQEKAEEQAEAEERSEMQQENEALKEENERLQEENEQQEGGSQDPDGQDPEGSGSGSPDVIIQSNEDWTAAPSEAPEGVVVVSPDYNVQAVGTEEAYAIDAAIAYYQAVEIGDYYTTHGLLSVEDQNLYPVDAWVRANTNLDSEAGEFVVTGAYPDSVGNYSPTYAVTVSVYLPDGTSFDRTTYFTDEGNGYWAHWLSDEEMGMFNDAL